MPKKLSQDQITTRAKPVMQMIALAGGILSTTDFSLPVSSQVTTLMNYTAFKKYSKMLCDELMSREFKNIDFVFDELAKWWYPIDVITGQYSDNFKVRPTQIANYAAWYCSELSICWDNSDKAVSTTQERAAFSETMLGACIDLYDCYLVPKKAQKKATNVNVAATKIINSTSSATPSTSVGSTTKSSAGSAPQNNYKASGAQSKNVTDLKGAPGQKIILKTVYRINTDEKGKHPFIKPLNSSATINGTNKIFYGLGHAYTDCEVFFENNIDADAFLVQLKNAAKSTTPALNNAIVVKGNPLSNGYFKVGTIYGDVYISAAKLNEELPTATLSDSGTVIESKDIMPDNKKCVNRSYRKKLLQDLQEMADNHISYVTDPDQFGRDLALEY